MSWNDLKFRCVEKFENVPISSDIWYTFLVSKCPFSRFFQRRVAGTIFMSCKSIAEFRLSLIGRSNAYYDVLWTNISDFKQLWSFKGKWNAKFLYTNSKLEGRLVMRIMRIKRNEISYWESISWSTYGFRGFCNSSTK